MVKKYLTKSIENIVVLLYDIVDKYAKIKNTLMRLRYDSGIRELVPAIIHTWKISKKSTVSFQLSINYNS